MKVVTVIPARYESQRLPGKPLTKIQDKPMIQWVYEQAAQVPGIERTIVATDDNRIEEAVRGFGGECMMTSAEIRSGTERVAAVAKQVPADIYVNVQGDEPMIRPGEIEKAVALVPRFSVGTLAAPLQPGELESESVVKVSFGSDGKAKDFSRTSGDWKHIGLYVYTREALERWVSLPPTEREKKERLEQLRAFENGISFGVASVETKALGVDTPEELERVRELFASGKW